jgi:hypothetical protein
MITNNQPLVRAKGASTLARAKFGPGMLLQHDDLEQLNVYTREFNRLMFRSLFGCGIVCGLVVGTEMKRGKVKVMVGSGLALDCQGDPIYVPKPQSIVLDEQCDPDIPSPLWVVLCRTAKCCAARTSECASDEDDAPSVCTRERDGFEIRIVRTRPHCTCSCPEPDPKDPTQALLDQACKCVNPEHKCYVDHYAGKCECNCNDCAGCDCDCVLLARLDESGDDPDHPAWTPDHRVRRFVRPVLMRDPQRSRRTREGNPPPTLRGKRSPSPERSCGSCDHGGGTCLGAQAGRRGAAAGGRSADRRSCRRGAPDAGGAHVAATPGQSRHTDICCARDGPGKNAR